MEEEKKPLTFSLRDPEHFMLPTDAGHSKPVAQRLTKALGRLREAQNSPHLYDEIRSGVEWLLTWRMSNRQLLLAHYILAQCLGRENPQEAIAKCSDALRLAREMHEEGAVADILFLRGATFRAVSEFDAAADDYDLLLRILREHIEDMMAPSTEERPFVLATLIGLGHFRIWQERFAEAEEHLKAAATLSQGEGFELDYATIQWLHALIQRYQNHPHAAMLHAVAAAEIYERVPARAVSTVRLLALAGDLALDGAAAHPPHAPARRKHEHLHRAQEYALRALRIARRERDVSGRGLAMLVRARLEGVRGREARAKGLIEAVVRLADGVDDWALRSQAHTALGHVLWAQGDLNGAERAFTEALLDLEQVRTQALGIEPRRALKRLREQRHQEPHPPV